MVGVVEGPKTILPVRYNPMQRHPCLVVFFSCLFVFVDVHV